MFVSDDLSSLYIEANKDVQNIIDLNILQHFLHQIFITVTKTLHKTYTKIKQNKKKSVAKPKRGFPLKAMSTLIGSFSTDQNI